MRAREAPRPTFYGQTILKKALETAKRFCYKKRFQLRKTKQKRVTDYPVNCRFTYLQVCSGKTKYEKGSLISLTTPN